MKKFFVPILAAVILLTCTQAAAKVQIDFGASEIYTQAEMKDAVKIIKKQFGNWKGCKLKNIRYAGDTCNNEENLKWMQNLRPNENFVQCIEFLSDFYVGKKTNTTFNPDSEYKDWQWWLARSENGNWQLVTFGY